MALEIVKTFTIKAPPALVWEFLIDPHKVVRCLPGAALTGQLDAKTYTGTMTVKVGPVQSSYKGKVIFERLDAVTRTAEILGSGQDTKGKGGAELKLVSSVKELSPGVTEVVATSQVNISGILAQMGRGMIQDVSDQMFKIFSERMRAELESAATAAPAPAAPPPVAPAPEATPAATAPASPPEAEVVAAATVATASKAPPPPPEVLDVGSVGGRVAVSILSRTLSSPALWLGLLLGILIGHYLWR